MDLIPGSLSALQDLSSVTGVDLVAELRSTAEAVAALVPSCVGFSVSGLHEQTTFTLVATAEDIARLDATQYLAGGPCVEVVDEGAAVRTADLLDPLNEERWQLFASVGAAAGVRSTLSFPLREDGEVSGSVNLYASSPRAFHGVEQEVAALFGAWVEDAVRNADLSWSSRTMAEDTPRRLGEQAIVHQAAGVLVAQQGLHPSRAQERLSMVARRAGVPEVVVAKVVLAMLPA